MKVLVGCETSGRVRDAFLSRGHNAMSCDILPTDSPGPHYQGDVRDILNDGWDLAIFHPPCTFLNSAGLHWIARGRIEADGRPRLDHYNEALDFVRLLLNCVIPRIAIENPTGAISTQIRPYDQRIQPHDFGDDASKGTCLWLVNLPQLAATCRIPGRMVEWPKGSGKFVERWANQTDSGQNNLPPSKNRWKLRSTTYPGIANAMADQWSQPTPSTP